MNEFLSYLLRVNLALSVVIVAILIARLPMRRAFGSWGAYALWWVAPVALWGALMRGSDAPAPEVAAAPMAPITDVVSAVEAVIAPAAQASAAAPFPWMFALWALGGLAAAAWIGVQQIRFLGRARRGLAGPAVVGLFAPRIVTPADFEQRYTDAERAIILDHERVHLSRHDAQVNALVAAVQCLCWFNPLVHLAAFCLRLDQELSCDAAVMSRRQTSGRAYAEAMIKAQGAGEALPLGCAWPAKARSILEKRIRLLRQRSPGPALRTLAAIVAVGLAMSAVTVARAVQPPTPTLTSAVAPASEAAFVLGREDAPVRIVEYGSPVCLHCAEPFLTLLPQLKARYINTGIVRYEYREIATQPQDLGLRALLTARSAGTAAYPAVMADIYRRQREMFEAPDPIAILREIASAHGVSERDFNARVLDTGKVTAMKAITDRNLAEGRINGTPYYAFTSIEHPGFMMRYGGQQSIQAMDEIIAATRRGEVREGPGLQGETAAMRLDARRTRVRDPNNPNDILQMDNLSVALRATDGFLRDTGKLPDRQSARSGVVHAVLIRDGRRDEITRTEQVANYAAFFPLANDAAIGITLDSPEGGWNIDALVSVGDHPTVHTGRLVMTPGVARRIPLHGGAVLELSVTPKT